jgi:hypothetical protein
MCNVFCGLPRLRFLLVLIGLHGFGSAQPSGGKGCGTRAILGVRQGGRWAVTVRHAAARVVVVRRGASGKREQCRGDEALF